MANGIHIRCSFCRAPTVDRGADAADFPRAERNFCRPWTFGEPRQRLVTGPATSDEVLEAATMLAVLGEPATLVRSLRGS
jgi:hypothetical protein